MAKVSKIFGCHGCVHNTCSGRKSLNPQKQAERSGRVARTCVLRRGMRVPVLILLGILTTVEVLCPHEVTELRAVSRLVLGFAIPNIGPDGGSCPNWYPRKYRGSIKLDHKSRHLPGDVSASFR